MKKVLVHVVFSIFGVVTLHLDTLCITSNQQIKLSPSKKRISLADRRKKISAQKKQFPATFGKTHFIVGFPHTTFKQKQHQNSHKNLSHLIASDGTIKQALFAPDDNIQDTIISLFESEQDAIKIAIFLFTNADIANALAKVADSGIPIELITDSYALHDPFNKIKQLHEHGVHIFIYKPIRSKSFIGDKMHNKFILFGKNIHDKPLLWTGSLNLTKSASKNNRENVIVIDDALLIEKFNQQFNQLKNCSERYVYPS
ncbi:DUF1669 domain-containing protein [Candidatus Dependentiae bacterium]|nr:MAG: DUF1669 domain-containing protein [Candidatus Dependentiae bacterium]